MKMKNKKHVLIGTILVFLGIVIVGIILMNFLRERQIEHRLGHEDYILSKTHYQGVDCNQLTGESAGPYSDILQPRKSICAAERAWFENNPSFCKLHDDPNHCFTWMAIKLKNPLLCNESGVNKENCLELVETTKNEDTWHWDYIRRNQNPI